MSIDDLQDRADKLMYRAKQLGKNQYLLDGFSEEDDTDKANK